MEKFFDENTRKVNLEGTTDEGKGFGVCGNFTIICRKEGDAYTCLAMQISPEYPTEHGTVRGTHTLKYIVFTRPTKQEAIYKVFRAELAYVVENINRFGLLNGYLGSKYYSLKGIPASEKKRLYVLETLLQLEKVWGKDTISSYAWYKKARAKYGY